MKNEDGNSNVKCTVADCDMTFENEVQLRTHNIKHHASLKMSSSDGLTDGTPTPTNLLRCCEEAGIFDDLGIQPDPFEEQFHKANQQGIKMVTPDAVVQDQVTLDTPTVLLSSEEPCFTLSPVAPLDQSDIPIYSDILPEPLSPLESSGSVSSAQSDSESSSFVSSIVHEYDVEGIQQHAMSSGAVESTVTSLPAVVSTVASQPAAKHSAEQAVFQVPVGVPLRSNRRSQIPLRAKVHKEIKPAGSFPTSRHTIYSLPAPAPVSSTIIQVPSILGTSTTSSETSGPLVQVIVNVDSQPMCYKMWAVPNVLNSPATSSATSTSDLTSDTTDVTGVESSTESHAHLGDPTTEAAAQSTSFPVQSPFGSTPSHSRRRGCGGSLEEQRRDILERNRAAAFRCRIKKKKRVDDLVTKCQYLTEQNIQMRRDLANARKEIADLRAWQLAHNNGPAPDEEGEPPLPS